MFPVQNRGAALCSLPAPRCSAHGTISLCFGNAGSVGKPFLMGDSSYYLLRLLLSCFMSWSHAASSSFNYFITMLSHFSAVARDCGGPAGAHLTVSNLKSQWNL